RRVTVAAASRAELPAAVAWEAEQYLPFDPADVHIAWDVIDSDAARGTIDILLVAARKTSIADRVSLFDGTGYPPVIVDAEACALTNAYLANYSDDDSGLSLLVHAGRRMGNRSSRVTCRRVSRYTSTRCSANSRRAVSTKTMRSTSSRAGTRRG